MSLDHPFTGFVRRLHQRQFNTRKFGEAAWMVRRGFRSLFPACRWPRQICPDPLLFLRCGSELERRLRHSARYSFRIFRRNHRGLASDWEAGIRRRRRCHFGFWLPASRRPREVSAAHWGHPRLGHRRGLNWVRRRSRFRPCLKWLVLLRGRRAWRFRVVAQKWTPHRSHCAWLAFGSRIGFLIRQQRFPTWIHVLRFLSRRNRSRFGHQKKRFLQLGFSLKSFGFHIPGIQEGTIFSCWSWLGFHSAHPLALHRWRVLAWRARFGSGRLVE